MQMGLLCVLLVYPLVLTVCDPNWVSAGLLFQFVSQGPTNSFPSSFGTGLHACTSAVCYIFLLPYQAVHSAMPLSVHRQPYMLTLLFNDLKPEQGLGGATPTV